MKVENSRNSRRQIAQFASRYWWEPQLRSFTDAVGQTISSKVNSDWVNRWLPMAVQETLPLGTCPEMSALYERLYAQIGKETSIGEWERVSQRRINEFARVTGDSQWIHVDPARAAEDSPFGTTVAHGFLTLSLIPMLTGSVDPEGGVDVYPEAKMIVNQGLRSVRFLSPVKAGAQIRARTKLLDLVPMSKRIKLINEVSVEIQNSRHRACVAEVVIMLHF